MAENGWNETGVDTIKLTAELKIKHSKKKLIGTNFSWIAPFLLVENTWDRILKVRSLTPTL